MADEGWSPSFLSSLFRLLGVVAFLAAAWPAAAGAAGQHILVFGFDLADTSGETQKPYHGPWLEAASDLLAARLREAGFEVVGPVRPPSGGVPIRSCNGCEVGIAADAGADIAATGTVHKVSSLILSVTIVLRDVATGETSGWTADIRGDNERSWLRGVDWLAEHRVLPHLGRPDAGPDPAGEDVGQGPMQDHQRDEE